MVVRACGQNISACESTESAAVRCGTPAGRKSPKATHAGRKPHEALRAAAQPRPRSPPPASPSLLLRVFFGSIGRPACPSVARLGATVLSSAFCSVSMASADGEAGNCGSCRGHGLQTYSYRTARSSLHLGVRAWALARGRLAATC